MIGYCWQDDMKQLLGQLNIFTFFANRECFNINAKRSSVITQGLPSEELNSIRETCGKSSQPLKFEDNFTHLGVNYGFNGSFHRLSKLLKLE